MNQHFKIALIGASGRTGHQILRQLIQLGYQVNALVRDPGKLTIKSPLVKIIQGDALDREKIQELLSGCNGIISTIGQRPGEPLVAELGTKYVLEAMKQQWIRRYVLLAGINIDTPFDHKGPETATATNWMKANYPDIQSDRQNAYSRLTESNADWTLVRVPMIEFTAETGEIRVDLTDCPGNHISAGSIADFMIRQLNDVSFLNQAPFIANV